VIGVQAAARSNATQDRRRVALTGRAYQGVRPAPVAAAPATAADPV